jgi:hypothetical protein
LPKHETTTRTPICYSALFKSQLTSTWYTQKVHVVDEKFKAVAGFIIEILL